MKDFKVTVNYNQISKNGIKLEFPILDQSSSAYFKAETLDEATKTAQYRVKMDFEPLGREVTSINVIEISKEEYINHLLENIKNIAITNFMRMKGIKDKSIAQAKEDLDLVEQALYVAFQTLGMLQFNIASDEEEPESIN